MNPSLSLLLFCIPLTVATSEELNLPDPLAVLSSCQQSSTAPGCSCQSAVSNASPPGGFSDATACSRTQSGGGTQWWLARLPLNHAGARVTFVRVDQLNDCCRDAAKPLPTVTLDGNDCSLSRFLGRRSSQVFFCNRTGQVVQIASGVPNEPLIVCRVQVFAEYLADFDEDHPQLSLSSCSRSPAIPGPPTCQYAMDGSIRGGPCISVPSNGWWEARLQDASLVKYIRMYSPLACCLDIPFKFAVTVDGSECVTYSATYFSARDFLCNRTGQVIRVENRMHAGSLRLCELQAFGDTQTPVDYGDPLRLIGCSQSSTVRRGRCRKALDGSTAQVCGRCARTAVERGWWQGRIKRRALVKFVRIYLPAVGSGCGPEDLGQALVTISGQECTPFESGTSVHTLFCNATGREVTIRSLAASELTICEVQAMGKYLEPKGKYLEPPGKYLEPKRQFKHQPRPEPPRNLSRHQLTRCSQSSSAAGSSRCHLAFDGSRRRCAKTAAERAAWWHARVRPVSGGGRTRAHRVATVILALQHSVPREGLSAAVLRRLLVSVNSQPCRLHSRTGSGGSAGVAFECNRVGSLIRVSNRPGRLAPLVLCEVLVLAWPIH